MMTTKEDSDLGEIDVDGPDVIGHGDDSVEEWGGTPLGEAIALLNEVLSQGDGAGFAAADWQDIFQRVPSLAELAGHAGGYESIEQLLQDLPGFDCGHHRWGGDSPGLSGSYLVFRAAPADQPSLVDVVRALMDAVQTYLAYSVEFAEYMEAYEAKVEEFRRKKEELRLEKEAAAAAQFAAGEGRLRVSYQALVERLWARFGISLNGPLLTFADGTGYLIGSIFEEELAQFDWGRTLLESEPVQSGRVQVVRYKIKCKRVTRYGQPIYGSMVLREAGQWFGEHFAWERAWWVVLYLRSSNRTERAIPDVPVDLRVADARRTEWRELVAESW